MADSSTTGPGRGTDGPSRTPASLSAQARQAVRQRIVDRRSPQGSRFVEREVAEELGRRVLGRGTAPGRRGEPRARRGCHQDARQRTRGLPDQDPLTQVYAREQLSEAVAADGYRVAAHGGADVMGLAHADFEPGSPADFVLVRGECLPQVVVDMPQRDMVVHGGRIVARDGEPVG